MTDPSASKDTFVIVGTNHQTGSLTLRDRLFVEDGDVPAMLQRLKMADFPSAYVISTCDRIEIGAMVDDVDAAKVVLTDTLASHGGLVAKDIEPSLYLKSNDDAVRHLFRVASSLNSVVVGEPQVLGQVKACHRIARDQGMIDGRLERILQAAYGVAKRVRTETAIGERPVSIAAVAVSVARDVHGDLAKVNGLVLGNGEMGEVIAREVQRAGLTALRAADVAERRTEALAAGLGIEHLPASELAAGLAKADVIITAVGGRGYSLGVDMVRTALKARRYRPQFIIDASLPSDVEPAVDRLDDAFLYDIGDLERLAMEGRASREAEAEAAEKIIAAELSAHVGRSRARGAAPIVTAFREKGEQLRQEALDAAGGDAEKATHILLQKLLHAPSEHLREMAEQDRDLADVEELLRDIFEIDDWKEPDA